MTDDRQMRDRQAEERDVELNDLEPGADARGGEIRLILGEQKSIDGSSGPRPS